MCQPLSASFVNVPVARRTPVEDQSEPVWPVPAPTPLKKCTPSTRPSISAVNLIPRLTAASVDVVAVGVTPSKRPQGQPAGSAPVVNVQVSGAAITLFPRSVVPCTRTVYEVLGWEVAIGENVAARASLS